MSENALDSDGQVRIARLDSADKCLATLAGNRHSRLYNLLCLKAFVHEQMCGFLLYAL